MTREQQLRIAIAEACGWTDVRITPEEGHGYMSERIVGLHPEQSNPDNSEWLPDYPNDLNAMHDAEKVLLRGYEDDPELSELWSDYQTNLILACPAYLSYHATAAHKSEAFCRTLKIGPFAE